MAISQEEKTISIAGILVLTVLLLVAALSVFSIMQQQTESVISNSLEVALQSKVALFKKIIKQGLSDTQAVATLEFLIQDLERIQASRLNNESAIALDQVAEVLLKEGFSGVVVYDDTENELEKAGDITLNPAFIVSLETDSDTRAFLLWNEQLSLRVLVNVLNQEGQQIGSIMTEQRLPIMTAIFTEAFPIGKTGDFMLCAPAKENDLEMDCFLRGVDSNEFKRMKRVTSDRPSPMHYSLEGKSGIVFAQDYRQEEVMAAYSPVAYGLGAVFKIDKNELFESITKQIKDDLLYHIIFIVSGVVLLYWLVISLMRKLIKSGQALQQVNTELTAYMDAIGKLTSLSITDKQGRILQVNKAFCEVCGYSREELMGQDHRILNSRMHSHDFFAEMWETIIAGDIWHGEICNRSKSGMTYWVDCSIVPIKNSMHQIDRFLSVRVDITSRKKNDMVLRERLKESICLHAIRYDLGLNLAINVVFQKIVHHLLQAIQFPDIAVVEIEFDNQRFTTRGNIARNFGEHISTNKLQEDIVVNGEICGKLVVFYLIDVPFLLPEEQDLVNTIARDIGRWLEKKEDAQRIAEMATHDALTGLPNRHLLHTRIEQAISQNSGGKMHVAVLFIDLDHFKIINDSLGHAMGDLLLKEVSKRLATHVRAEDTVARQGGDEFIVVLNDLADTQYVGTVARKILDTIVQPYKIKGSEMHIGCSIGIAIFPADGTDAETLLKNSDAAMYHAKKIGRNNFQFFHPEMIQLATERQQLDTDLRYAIERNELVLFYQPVIYMPNSELKSMEVLLHWEHPAQGLISPLKFISLAEDNGMIIPIGEWVLQTACEQIKAWQDLGYDVPRLAVNISAKQFNDDRLIEKIEHILDRTGVDTQYLSLELTESLFVSNVESVVAKLNRLREMGIKILIDDFGVGYSSLSYLKHFPIDILKIDRSFIQNITTDSNDITIVIAILAMAESLGMDVIAEGVETEEQLDLLVEKGCKRFQGFYFSKSRPAAEIEGMLQLQQQDAISVNA